MLDRVAAFSKPIAVGIHGACLGGGLEFALACRYRVATDHPKTQLGLPEIQLGILPGAGGCQRLPRLIGARAALDIILAGKSERAAKAYRLGMVDELVPPAILKDITIAAARRMAERGVMRAAAARRSLRLPARRQSARTAARVPPGPQAGARADEGQLPGTARRARGRPPRADATAWRPACSARPQLFGQLAVTDVSRKLVQIFFATPRSQEGLRHRRRPQARRGSPARHRRVRVHGGGDRGHGGGPGRRGCPPEGRRSAARRQRASPPRAASWTSASRGAVSRSTSTPASSRCSRAATATRGSAPPIS